jgi:TRAP-type C4-dicarboxylate transport system permease small subunit
MTRLLAAVNTVSAVCGAVLMLFIMFSISYGALTRTFKLPSPIWIVQISEYGLVWVCFLATAWVLAENKHVRVDILFSRFNRQKQALLLLVQNTVSAVLCGIFCYLGILSTWEHLRDKVVDVGSIDVPKAWIIGVIPFGFLLLTLQFLVRAAEDLRGLKAEGGSLEEHPPTLATGETPGKAGG